MRHGIFVLVDPPTPEDDAAARAVVDAYTFPWEWTVKRNVRETGRAILPVGFKERDGSLGFYTQGLNRIDVDPVAVLGAQQFGRTFAHELGHLIDDTVLLNETRREIHALMHRDSPVPLADCPAGDLWRGGGAHANRPNEAFANLAPHIWCPLHAKPIDRYGPHRFSRLDDIEELVMADAVKNPPFDDIADLPEEHRQAIEWATGRGLIEGKKGGKFEPHAPLTRAQWCLTEKRKHDRQVASSAGGS